MERFSATITVWNCDESIAMEEDMVRKGYTFLTSLHGDTLLWNVEPKHYLDIFHEASHRGLEVHARMAA